MGNSQPIHYWEVKIQSTGARFDRKGARHVIDGYQFLHSPGYKAGLDYPLSAFCKELLKVFPDAKVILAVRDPQRWYESTLETIYQGAPIPDLLLRFLPPFRGFEHMLQSTTWAGSSMAALRIVSTPSASSKTTSPK